RGWEDNTLVTLIVGAPSAALPQTAPGAPAPDVISLPTAAAEESAEKRGVLEPGQHAAVGHLYGERLEDLSFQIGAGEILGVAGLIGSGAEDLPYLLFGAQPAISGTLRLGDEELDSSR